MTDPPAPTNETRGPIESTHNRLRDTREQQYITDREALADTYRTDLDTIQTNKETALMAAGLNADGSMPPQEVPPELPDIGA